MAITNLTNPGVFIQENNNSFIPTGTGVENAAFVGPTPRGPAFEAIVVTSYQEYITKFGDSDGNSYMPYAIQSYLENSDSATIIRVLSTGGYTHNNVAHVVMSGSYGKQIISSFCRSATATALNGAEELGGSSIDFTSATDFILTLSGSFTNLENSFSASVVSTDSTFLGKQVSTTPNTSEVAYDYALFSNSMDSLYTTDSGSVVSLEFTDVSFDSIEYSEAITPWITSQKKSGIATNLFKCHTISDGTNTNKYIKIAISDVVYGDEVPNTEYGTFTLTVREYDDNDRVQIILDTFVGITLDPTSPNFIAKAIGDKYPTYSDGDIQYNGDYPNISKYIYIEMNPDVTNGAIAAELIPFGFRAVQQPFKPNTGTTYPAVSIVTDQVYNSEYNNKIYYGYDFNFTTTDNESYLQPIEATSGVGLNVDFNLSDYSVNSGSSDDPGVSIIDADNTNARKFILPFQGGFDGSDPAIQKSTGNDISATNTMGFDVSASTTSDFEAYDRANSILANADFYNINMLSTPGLIYKYHPALMQRFLDMIEARGDVFYPIDSSALTDSIATAKSTIASLDTTYASDYYPWVEIFDQNMNRNTWVPATCRVVGQIAYSDNNSYQWFAPAGLNRGQLTTTLRAYKRLNRTQLGDLYNWGINPLMTFPNEGVVIWGQKTLAKKESALDRINVRRLLINLKKFISSSGRYILFEQNDRNTRESYLNQLVPYMEDIKQKAGVYEFVAVMDETNNTAAVIARNVIALDVFIKPTKTAEFMQVQLNIEPDGSTIEIS